MSLTRRVFLKATCAVTSFPLWAHGDENPVSAQSLLTSDFESRGYVRVDPQPMSAEYSFNGGNRYDEYPMASDGPRSFVVQKCKRLEDSEGEKGPVVLPEFHMLVYSSAPAIGARASTRLMLEILTSTLGLDPTRIAVVTADDFTETLAELSDFGIGEDQVFVRQASEARRRGDGSGFFGPEGYPGPKYPTASFHYSRQAGTAGRITEYPLQRDVVEIGEVGSAGGGIGIERAQWAI